MTRQDSIADVAREVFCAGYALAVEQAIELLRAAGADEDSVALLVSMRARVPAVHAMAAIDKTKS